MLPQRARHYARVFWFFFSEKTILLMCGIAGIALAPDRPPPDQRTLDALRQALAHRGPDGAGSIIIGNTGLVHTRLAIIDLACGDQPLFAGSSALIANGEIYNNLELRAAMSNVAFATGSDCEPPLHLWRRDGDAYAVQLRGMFAIAIHDSDGRTLTLTRDPFGIKPLYIGIIDGGVAFASEPQALLAAGLCTRDLCASARDELLQMQFTTGSQTIFADIQRVLPGETLRIRDGVIAGRDRIAALPAGGPEDISEAEALDRLESALLDSVEHHQRSDVPYGMFLSGGIDSACVLACMARLNATQVLAYTAGFDVPGAADERAQAAAVAACVGARHETIEISADMVWRHLPRIVAAMDDPAADYAIIPTYFLAERAHQEVRVVLSGEGGDEMFGGYGRYRSAMRPWFLGGRAMRSRGVFDGLDVLRAPPHGWHDGVASAEAGAASPGRTRLQMAQATDMADWLPNDLLTKLDRCLMAHGVEGRTPFLDPAIVQAAFRLPDALKIRDGRGKYLLRLWLSRAMSASQPFAPKQGFTVPIGAWMASQAQRLGPLVAAQPGVAEVAYPDRVTRLFERAAGKREGMAAWMLLFYALWHRVHVEDRGRDADVFDALS